MNAILAMLDVAMAVPILKVAIIVAVMKDLYWMLIITLVMVRLVMMTLNYCYAQLAGINLLMIWQSFQFKNFVS